MADEKDQTPQDEEKGEKEKKDLPGASKDAEEETPAEEAKPEEKPSANAPGETPSEEPKAEEKPADVSAETQGVKAETPTPEPAPEPVPVPEPPKPKEEKPKPAPTGKFKDLIKDIEGLSVADLAELVKALEERFGVSAAAMPVAAAGGAAVGAAGEAPAEEKTNYTVVLADTGVQKIAVIKAVREINQQLGLKEAKDLVEAAPKEVAKDVSKTDAQEAKKKLEAAGAKVELK